MSQYRFDILLPLGAYLQEIEDTRKIMYLSEDREDDSMHEKNFTRTLFSGIEGTISTLKSACLLVGQRKGLITDMEVSLLKEVSYDVNDKGQGVIKPKIISTAPNLRYTVSIVNKIFECKYDLGTGTKNWEAFRSSIKVRDRVTHPKSIDDFNISTNELNNLILVADWFAALIKYYQANIKQIPWE